MNWNNIGVRTTENGQKAEVGLWLPEDSLQRVMKQNKNIVKRRSVVQKAEVDLSCCKDSIQNVMKENFQKAVVGLRHPKNIILVEMKGTKYKGTGAVQKVEVCLDHHKKRKLVEMKGKEHFFESTEPIQKSGVGLDHH